MLNNPYVRYGLRIGVVALSALIASLQAGSEFLDAIYAAFVAGAAYAGIGAATPIEQNVGVKAKGA